MVEEVTALGDFRILGVLGEGGGGIVYEAEGPEGVVALKVPHPDRELTDRDRRRYLDEAAMMDRVRHPAIVEVLASGTLPDGRPFVAMPRLSGRTVAERVFERGPFDLDTALRLIDQLADATAALHAEDLLHRDLKAENVFLVGDDDEVRLLDFGIAKDRRGASSRTTTGMVRGTPATMAPERFFGAEATERSDVYELAVVFYVMVVGQLPWSIDDTDLVQARANPVPAHMARATVSPAVSAVVLRALATEPQSRPATPRELADALRAAAAEPAPPAFAATVTSESLRPLIENETPFDAAVASRPGRDVPEPPARRLWPLALAAGIALFLGAQLALPAMGAPATASLGSVMAQASLRVMSTLQEARATPPTADASPDDEQDDTGSVDGGSVDGGSVDEAPAAETRPNTTQPNAKRPAHSAKANRPTSAPIQPPVQPPVQPPARPAAPEPTTTAASTPIPGGVYDHSPY